MKKFYLLTILLLSVAITGAIAQDSTVCNANFQTDILGNEVFFRAMDSMPGVRHNWIFGDGSSKSTDSFAVIHFYGASGVYTVTHVVVDSAHHCQDSSTQQ